MRRMIKALLLTTVAASALVFAVPTASRAADVTPVRHGHYYRYHYVPHHDYYRHWYRYPGRSYYYSPGVHVYRYPYRHYDYYYDYHPRGGVHIGPFGIHW